ncbi:hypothetical protein JI721_08570 [Alicyclobacillus cycloheptanicus]|uniref:DUF3592 domain-containing protein n=1 Tax=Alicyclobacillus cycloheptanicus TaxID=1457 RepID=A0ABT9XM26_9BACL|nr:hypothetical protein [Alicyclobacillus cycloheptanicus]MDQ0191367.1 hypothetical protein [Alicyclobacillus cycloheptanicus]WDL99846.1 hypothetical protein JI721_08570 [Alicyclobacillus cycloheptanicus]
MRTGFRAQPRRRLPGWLLLLALLAVAIGVFELIRVIIPFQSENPLWQEVTVGQPVIDGWLYGGQDEEGYLRFYNQSQTIVLPPSSHMFDADGQFVVIEHYSPSTLTFAQPYDAIPTGWLLAGLGVLVLGGMLVVRRFRRPRLPFQARRPFRTRSSPRRRGFGPHTGWTSRPLNRTTSDAHTPGWEEPYPQDLESFRTPASRKSFRPGKGRPRWFR